MTAGNQGGVRARIGELAERVQASALGPKLREAVSRAGAVRWRLRGRPAPAPPHLKRRIVCELTRRAAARTFVETGTYRGDTIAAVARDVDRVISIELDPRLADAATRRFRARGNVSILVGDSGDALPKVVAELDQPALLWLDGHFSGGVTALGVHVTPIEQELEPILDASRPAHLVLVDDIRLFDGTDGYPTLERIRELVAAHRPGAVVDVADDIARIGFSGR
jgi:Methyltransferase domain